MTGRSERGSVGTLVLPALAGLGVALVLLIDLAAYLTAAARAQAAADLAALAAVAAADPDAEGRTRGRPAAVAAQVAAANGADLVACDCDRGADEVVVRVAVGVRTVAVARFAGRTVAAEARAGREPP